MIEPLIFIALSRALQKRHLRQSTLPHVKDTNIYNHSPLEFGRVGRPSCPLQRRAQSLFSSCGPATRIIKTNSDGGNNDDNEKDNDDNDDDDQNASPLLVFLAG